MTFAQVNNLALQAMWANLKQLPTVFGMAFLSTLVTGALQKLIDYLMNQDSSDDTNNYQLDLTQPYAEKAAEPKKPKAFTDIISPNLVSLDQLDVVSEMAICPDSRGFWNCTMDNGLLQAVRGASPDGPQTVARAAGLGVSGATELLHKDWELIPAIDTKDDQDPGCYQRAYCASNLAKLRFARILPIGWELAANSPFNIKNNGKYVTLGAVLRGFNDCNKDNKLDAQHPWCHLIDPTWVLTAPPFKCQIKGYGDTLQVAGLDARMQECSDPVSCLKRDDKGVCIGGYGYCLSEKTVWRFGADACDEKFVSCRTYTTRPDGYQKGSEVSYIRNSLDYGACNQDNIGCMFYATQYDPAVTSTLKWLNTATYNGKSVSLGTMPRIYFDNKVEACNPASDGCTKVLRVKPGQNALNLVRNGSFENTLKNQDGYYDGWYDGAQPTKPAAVSSLDTNDGEVSFDGDRSQAWTNTTNKLVQSVKVMPLRNYVLSFYARSNGNDPIASVTAILLNTSGSKVASGTPYYRSPNCNAVFAGQPEADKFTGANVGASDLSSDWKRYTCEFVTNKDAAGAKIVVAAKNAAIDAVQLEEGDAPTDFLDGVNMALEALHIKLPPEELGCTGDKNLDRKECDQYAKMCLQADAGCQGYMEVGGGDQTEVPAILALNDYCPNSCVGYAEYHKLPSAFDLTNTGASVPANDPLDDPNDDTKVIFIPKQAQACNQAQAGCEEFTNIESAALGGEEKAYLTYARACQKPNDFSQTYFTWEGSDTTGYQLKTWSLIRSKDPVDPNDPTPHYAPLTIEKAGPEGYIKDSADCTAATWAQGTDPDCRQFYDEQGKAFYAFYSKTVVSSADCRDYRKNNSDIDDCVKTGGNFQAATGDCVYSLLLAESAQCEPVNAGCRGYLGTTGRNTETVLKESFSATSSKTFYGQGQGTTLTISSEALLVGDHSLKFQGTGSLNVDFPSTTNTLYNISFWFKSIDSSAKTVTVSLGGNPVASFKASLDWKRFELGPFRALGSPTSTLTFSGLPSPTYIDEVSIQRLQDVVFVKKDSWTIPAECDQTSEGIPQPQAMLGCREYRDRNGKIVDVRQFSRLCRYEAIGCTALVDTRNSDNAYAESFSLAGYDPQTLTKAWDKLYSGTLTVTRPADRYLYVIDDPGVRCPATDDSCRAFGRPTFDAFGVPSSTFETVYLKDDIKNYVDAGGEPNMLCRPSELFCDKFVSGPVTSYFRDPREHVCEWKEKVHLKAPTSPPYYQEGDYSGWFVKGVDPPVPCYPEKQAGGNSFLTEFSAAPGYRGWVNLCPSEQSECTEYRDPNDKSDQAHPGGKPYFFIANDAIDTASCKGKVDLLSGCVLFRDMSNSALTFNTAATYAKSHADGDTAVGAINCENDPTNQYCTLTGKCTDLRMVDCGGDGCEGTWENFITLKTGANCSTDDDCSHVPAYGDPDGWEVRGRCQKNDANLIIKVKLDRDCQSWLGCSTYETVYDPSQQKYIDLCTNLAVCDQVGGSANTNLCGHYVDRTSTRKARADLLAKGRFLDIGSYIRRPTGFGTIDYSGFSIPNHFQVSDLQMRRVAYELLANRPSSQRDALYNDFRLVAAVPMTTEHLLANQWYAVDYKDNAYPYLNLCKHPQTGLIGYTIKNETPQNCYLPIEKPYTTVLNEALGQFLGLPGNAQKISVTFEENPNAALDNTLNRNYPPIECRAHPEMSSPFSNQFIKEWDLTAEPPVPKTFLDGYDEVSYCEYGENCDCSYRKVSYGAKTKYYSAFAGTAPVGICVDGPDEGKACDPEAEAAQAKKEKQNEQAAQNAALAQALAQATNQQNMSSENKSSGSDIVPAMCRNGTCAPLQKDTLVRGVVGQCLQRDYSRTLGGALDKHPCLIWNPAPVLAGQQDRYHYDPQAGYLPPPSSGDYYCLSHARTPRTMKTQANTFNYYFKFDTVDSVGSLAKIIKEYGTIVTLEATPDQQKLMPIKTPPGKITYFDYHECFVMDPAYSRDPEIPANWDTDATANDDYYERICGRGATLDGSWVHGSDNGAACSWIRRQNGGGENRDLQGDIRAGRWITTGRGISRNYAEYFVEFNPVNWANWLYNTSEIKDENDKRVERAALEQNFTSFVFRPMYLPGTGGSWACGMSGWWVPEFHVDWNENSFNTAAQTMISQIMDKFKPLTPENFGFLKNETGTKLVRLPCKYPENGDESEGEPMCYYKYWETGYNADGEKKFRTFYDSVGGPRKLDPADVMFAEAEGSKPYFAIRAMFEDISKEDNAISEDHMDPSGTQLAGPFRFVGWWITTAFPGAQSERYIYMYLDINHADICRQVARTSSPTSHETAAFTDRIWENGAFSLPRLSYNYGTGNAPFGSAKNSRAIGHDPLYQLGPLAGGPTFKMASKQPTFLSSGASYYKTAKMPLGNWAYLNNIFAKIYNVYNYHDMPVGKSSWACVAGPNFGARCPNLDLLTDNNLGSKVDDIAKYKAEQSKKYCGYSGTCNPDLLDPLGGKDTAFCNALSGVNAGLPCSASLTPDGYHVCHAAPVRIVDGQFKPQYVPCDLAPGWKEVKAEDGTLQGYAYEGDDPGALEDCKAAGIPGCTSGQHSKFVLRKTAAKAGAFWCDEAGVRFPDGHRAFCRQPSNGKPSMDCPLMVWSGGQGPGKSVCDKTTHHCTNGYEHAECTEDWDCTFWWQTWWYLDMEKTGGQPTRPMPYPANHSTRLDPPPGWYLTYYPWEDGQVNYNWPIAVKQSGGGYAPYAVDSVMFGATPTDKYQEEAYHKSWWFGDKVGKESWLGTDGQTAAKDIGGNSFETEGKANFYNVKKPASRYYWFTERSKERNATQRFPGAFLIRIVLAVVGQRLDQYGSQWSGIIIPGHCERLPVSYKYCDAFKGKLGNPTAEAAGCVDKNSHPELLVDYQYVDSSLWQNGMVPIPYDVPYFDITAAEIYKIQVVPQVGGGVGEQLSKFGTYAVGRWLGPPDMKPGLCEGGVYDGMFCASDASCKPLWVTPDQDKATEQFCKPVSVKNNNKLVPASGNINIQPGNYSISYNCSYPLGNKETNNPDEDDNVCTHSTGYYPKADLCGMSLNKSVCLTAISQRDPWAVNLNESYNLKQWLPPTDVSSGLHIPSYLAEKNGKSVADYLDDYNYIAYYAPRPPTIAAPDTSRECASAGSCQILQVGTFSLDGVTQGKVAYIGGQSVNTIRFYGWAADNQLGIKDIWIDWGDGTRQEFHDSRMKNKKPICGATKECEFVPGLPCNSNNDCPPASGKCVDTSYCTTKSWIQCIDDSDCYESGMDVGDKCTPRMTFGNSDRGCEQNYFEYTHVYLCPKGNSLPNCGETKYCNRDNTTTCTTDSDCAKGDKCVAGLAPPGGCYDATNNACRFTPRVIIKDNWGWCSGECRVEDLGNGRLGPGFGGVNNILLPYGGCYDGTGETLNRDSSKPLDVTGYVSNKTTNMCDPYPTQKIKNLRPWIVFQGSLQLGVSQ